MQTGCACVFICMDTNKETFLHVRRTTDNVRIKSCIDQRKTTSFEQISTYHVPHKRIEKNYIDNFALV